jgi:hypothetical protein
MSVSTLTNSFLTKTAMIGPAIPGLIRPARSSIPPSGPSTSLQIQESFSSKPDTEDEEDEDDYTPALPPDLIAQRASQKRVQGPTLPSAAVPNDYDEDDEDDIGPMPLPPAYSNLHQEEDGVAEFLEREKRRKKAIEVRVRMLIVPTLFKNMTENAGSLQTQSTQKRRVDAGSA